MTTVQPSNSSELQLFQVLRRANLLKYFETFISQGGDDVQQLCEAGEDEFLEIMALVGMASKPLHVRRLQKALQEWVANPAAFEELKKYPSQIMITGNKSSLSVTSEHPLDILEDVDENLCPAQSSPPLTSTPYRSQVKDTSSSDGSTFDDPNSSDSQLGDYRDTARDYLVDQTHSGFLGMPDPRLSEHQIMAIATAASQLAKDLPPLEPKSAPKKPISQEILTVMQMSADEPHRMSALRQYAAIYGRFDSRRKNDKPMNMHEISVNEAAAQLCSHCPALLTRREELFPLARQVVRDSGYQYSKGHSRAADILLQSKLEVSDTVPSTQCLPHSAFHTVPSTPSAAIVSPELSLGVLKAELSQVKHELVEITKEQKNIRSSLRVLLESNDHDQMRKLAAKMDILNDRQTAMMNKRQKIKIAIAKCIKSSPDNCLLPDPCVQTSPVCAQFSTDSCVQTSPLCAQFSTDPCVQTSPLCAQFSTDPCVQTSPVCAQFSTDSCVQTSPVCAQFSTDSCVQTSPLCAQFSTDPCVQTSPLCAQFSTDPCVQTSPLCAQFSTDSTNNVTSSGCHGYINELESGNPLNTFNMESLPNQKDSIFEEGLRIARQYGMSDFAEQLIGLKSTTENVGSSKLSGNTPSDAGIPTLGCPSHKIASVPSASSSAAVVSLSSCAAATSSPPSLVLEYLKSGCRQYKKSHPSSSSSSLSLQTAVSPALNPVCAAEQHPLPIARTDIDPVSKNRHSSCEQEQT